jgi:hypothetical protein
MRSTSKAVVLALAAGAAACLGTSAAEAKCTRLSFLVNDYGKDGPTRDAKALLDKYIVNWTKEKGIKNYSVGKKDVKCELFLNFIVFDEHTCTASASVCWGEGATAGDEKPKPAAAAKSKSSSKPGLSSKPPSAKKAQVP